jgi:hypothetical protein
MGAQYGGIFLTEYSSILRFRAQRKMPHVGQFSGTVLHAAFFIKETQTVWKLVVPG